MNSSENNRKVAIARWNKVFERKTAEIRRTSVAYPQLKARILAYLMGDGSVIVRKDKTGDVHHSLHFFPDDEHMLTAFLEAFVKVYNQQPRIRRDKNYFRVTLESKPVVRDLLTNGSFHSLEWRVPEYAERECKREWLRAFYDCEAYVGPRVITVQSVNKTGLEQVQNMLKDFGILSRMYAYKRKQKTWNTNYLLTIGRCEDRVSFLNQMGFNHRRKLEKLKLHAAVAQPGTAVE